MSSFNIKARSYQVLVTNLTEITLDECRSGSIFGIHVNYIIIRTVTFEYLAFKAVFLGLHEYIKILSSHIVHINSLGQLKAQWYVVL